MPEFDLPEGQYLSLVNTIRPTAGGRTRALLMRNRLFADRAGIEPTIITTCENPDYDLVRESWTAQGYLVPQIRLFNAYEWYRDHDFEDLPEVGPPLVDLGDWEQDVLPHLDGTDFRTTYRHPSGAVVKDFRRADGTVYARASPDRLPVGGAVDAEESVAGFTIVNRAGRPVLEFPGVRPWLQHWLDALTPGGGRVFLFCDSRVALDRVAPLHDPRYHVLHVVHNAHTTPPRHWNSRVNRTYKRMTHLVPSVDACVLLTQRQREDYGERFGRTNNLFAVPNPVESPPRLVPAPPRDPMRFAMVCRVSKQKRPEDAIRAFALVAEQEPDARLDIYGDGDLLEEMQALIDSLGVDKAVTLHGWDPRARDQLWTASGFLMTSRVEGYPLATLESMSHGCPVVSYDIKYGPRDQITQGVDGFLVEPEDVRGMADRILEMIHDPALVARMSEAAFEKALQHDANAFLRDWRTVMDAAIAQKDLRARIGRVRLLERPAIGGAVSRNLVRVDSRLRRLVGRIRPQRSAGPLHGRFPVAGVLEVLGESRRGTLDSVVVSLDLTAPGTETVVGVPLEVSRDGNLFRFAGHLDLDEAMRSFPGLEKRVVLRLRVVWANRCWQTILDRSFRTIVGFAPSDRSK